MKTPITAALALAASLMLCASAPAAPTCSTPPADDGANVPCNPYLADSAYPAAHTNSYSQHSTPIAGPSPDDRVQVRHRPATGIPIAMFFSPPYRDGRRVAWIQTITATNAGLVYKPDTHSALPLAAYDRVTREGVVPERTPAISAVYAIVDRDNHFIKANGAALDVLGDGWPRRRSSAIRLLRRFALPARAKCGAGDYIVGVNLLFDGRVVFVTHGGIVGVVPREPERMRDRNLLVHSINGARCADPLEQVTNSVSADESGGIFPITDKAQYRFDVRGAEIAETWRAPYQTGNSGAGGTRQDAGSGTTPSLMGTAADDDQFVVLTDGRQLMHLVMMWRGAIPADWQGLPGRDRRVACELPVTFGDPDATSSQSENSVAIRGHAAFIPNNQLRGADATSAIPDATQRLIAAGLIGQSPANAPHGFERIDWDPATRTCRVAWVNKDVSIPNGVPYVSSGSELVYGIGQRNGIWGLEGMDLASGKSVLWIPSGPLPTQGSMYSAVNIDDEGNAWTGGLAGYTLFATRPDLPLPVG